MPPTIPFTSSAFLPPLVDLYNPLPVFCGPRHYSLAGWRQADEERRRGVAVDETVVDLAAVLHDVDDWKYRAPTDDPSLSHAQVRNTRLWHDVPSSVLTAVCVVWHMDSNSLRAKRK
jgi:hypothetical protein